MEPFKRGSSSLYPMPVRLKCPATLRVSDDAGWLVRSEELRADCNLVERLRDAHEVGSSKDGCPDPWLLETMTRDEEDRVKIVGFCQTVL